jgi:hypothetical protein
MLSDRSPANAAFVAWCAFKIILSKGELNETTGLATLGSASWELGSKSSVCFLWMVSAQSLKGVTLRWRLP